MTIDSNSSPDDAGFMAMRIEWSPDEKYVAYVVQALSTEPEFQGHKVISLDVETGSTIVVQRDGWPEYYTTVNAAIAWGGNKVLYASYQNTIRAYAVDGRLTDVISLDCPVTDNIVRIDVSQRHQLLVALISEIRWPSAQRLVVYDIQSRQRLTDLAEKLTESIDFNWVGFSPDDSRLIATGTGSILNWKVSELTTSPPIIQRYPTRVGWGSWSPDGRLFACGGPPLRVFDVGDWKEILTLMPGPLGGSFFFLNNRWLVVGKIAHNILDGREVIIPELDGARMSVSPSGLVAIGNTEKPASIFDAQWRQDEDLASFIVFKKLDLE